jgi:hypothetical protein
MDMSKAYQTKITCIQITANAKNDVCYYTSIPGPCTKSLNVCISVPCWESINLEIGLSAHLANSNTGQEIINTLPLTFPFSTYNFKQNTEH